MITFSSLTFTQVVLFLHIAAVVVAFGVTFAYPIIVPATIRKAPRHAAWLHQMQHQIGQMIITPAAALVLLTGIYLAADLDVFSEWWVGVPLVAILVILGLGGAYFSPRDKKLAELAERDIAAAGPDGEIAWSQEYQDLGRQVGMVGSLVSLLVLIVIFIMVVGPTL
jgi:small-conductance mechanosensitive channel